MRTARRYLITAVFCVLFPVLYPGCGGDGGTPADPGRGTIGPSGGTVTDAGGASVVIPPGALGAETAITVRTIPGKGGLPQEAQPFVPMLGGAEFGPSGTRFDIPVTLTIPVDPPAGPSDTVTVLYWDDTEGRWAALGGPATVLPGGAAVSVETTHFTLFSAVANVFDNFHENFGDGSNGRAVFDAYVSYFLSTVTWMHRKGLYDGDCHEVVGIHMTLGYRVEHLPGGPYYEDYPDYVDGESTQPEVVFYMAYDSVETGASGTVDKFYALEIHVSLRCCGAAVDVSASPSSIGTGETSTVTATVMCDDEAMAGYDVTFESLGGFGDVAPASATTSAGGAASTTFTAGEEEGRESVRASITHCDGQQTSDGAGQIEIGGEWGGTLAVTFTHDIGDEPLYTFTDHVSITANLTIEEGVVYGTGTGSHSISLSTADECSEQGMVAPSFPVVATGAVVGENLELMVVPTSMPLSFTLHCVWDTIEDDFPFPIYGMLETSILGQYISIDVPWENGGSDSGSGSDPAGGDIPMTFSWTFTLGGS